MVVGVEGVEGGGQGRAVIGGPGGLAFHGGVLVGVLQRMENKTNKRGGQPL